MEEPIEEDRPLGRLKTTLKERCGSCGHPLQLRVRSQEQLIKGDKTLMEITYKFCHICQLEFEDEHLEKEWKRVYTGYTREHLIIEKEIKDKNKERQNGRNKRPTTSSTSFRGNGRNH